jgi:hypothetical protein
MPARHLARCYTESVMLRVRIVRAATALCATLLIATLASAAKTPAAPITSAAPDMRELMLTLIRAQNLKFASFVHHEGCIPTETIGEYLATLIANSSEGDTHSTRASCSEYDPGHSKLHPPRDANAVWECHFRAYTADRDNVSPWHYELHFFIEKASRKLHTKTVACPGS